MSLLIPYNSRLIQLEITRKHANKIVIGHAHAWNCHRKEVEICATNLANKTK
jgi:hypothetical protein